MLLMLVRYKIFYINKILIKKGTDQNPIAGAEVHIAYSISTVLKVSKMEDIYFVEGDGTFKIISN